MKIAVITYEARGSYATTGVEDEDKILEVILKELGIDFSFEVWSDTSVDWIKYTHLLMKSPWDYFDRYAEFLDWCHRIKSLGIIMVNDIDTVIQNSDKRYLKGIEDRGFSIVPTIFNSKNHIPDLNACFDTFKTEQIVIKPTVSGGAKNTMKIEKDNWQVKQEEIQNLLASEDFMLQPFIREVAEVGEYSYLFFNGKFSHAVLKSAKSGEFRVQHFFGGQIHTFDPSLIELVYIQKIIDEFAADTMYARVDGVWIKGVFYLMELELIEPYLFLFTSKEGRENYKNAIRERFGS
ncbi:ATP-grasp domain-containing protein [Aquiflexum gelatinilyticum]|uniref:ATP-grasp domain-containing protein n=1 Tax=Aquiflexum gelatinilyticum TaxID=2961943 RepID=UPI002168C723|nr:glutathione synthetase [Aquiflexum gelatinilyticum]MCS4436744.1 glutathione synthetase [Aquiflexum gelatinilyticum]